MQTGNGFLPSIEALAQIDRSPERLSRKLERSLVIMAEALGAQQALLVTVEIAGCPRGARFGVGIEPAGLEALGACLVKVLPSLPQAPVMVESNGAGQLSALCSGELSATTSRPLIAAPLVCKRRTIGLVVLFRDGHTPFADLDRSFLSAAAAIVSLMSEKQMAASSAHASLRQIIVAKQEWEQTVDVLPQLVMLLDEEGRVARANRMTEKWLGISVKSVRAKSVHELLHPECADEGCVLGVAYAAAWRAAGENEPSGEEFYDARLRRYLRVEVRKPRSPDAEKTAGESRYAVLIFTDITLERRAREWLQKTNSRLESEVVRSQELLDKANRDLASESARKVRNAQALLESKSRYESLVNTTVTGIYIAECNRLVFCNRRLAEMFGYEEEQLKGFGLAELIESPSPDPYPAYASSSLEMPRAAVVRGMRKNGEVIWLVQSTAEVRYRGRPAVLGNLLDVSEQIRVQEELKHSKKELRNLSSQLLAVQEQERKRIASDLHDGIGQILSAIKINVENAIREYGAEKPEVFDRLQGVISKVQRCMDEVRRIAMDLRPATLDYLGVVATIRWFCREFQEDLPGIEIVKQVSVAESEVPDSLKTVIFRIMQEALNNVAKHSRATRAEVRLEAAGDRLVLTIADNGVGMAGTRGAIAGGGIGLISMKERAELTGGTLCLSSDAGRGTVLACAWPTDTRGADVVSRASEAAE